jgi:hypothetical protein
MDAVGSRGGDDLAGTRPCLLRHFYDASVTKTKVRALIGQSALLQL